MFAAALLANVFTDVIDWLAKLSGHWWFLAIIFGVAFFDSVVPVVPSESLVIVGGIAAGFGDQPLLAVIAAGAIGAFLGDNTAYLIGAKLRTRIVAYAAKHPKRQRRLDWAAEQIRLRGGLLLVTARFIPGGRTALTVSSGITSQPRPWFVGWITLAVLIWATYAALLGYLFGNRFKDDHTSAFLLAFGAAVSVTIGVEIVRHFRAKHS